jgi:hypothetical protein
MQLASRGKALDASAYPLTTALYAYVYLDQRPFNASGPLTKALMQ